MALVDALGNLVRFLLLPGQAHDMKGVAPLIRGVSFDALLADKAFDADWLLQDLDERGATAIIPPKANRKIQRDYDVEVYKWPLMSGKLSAALLFLYFSGGRDRTMTWHIHRNENQLC